jgi:hypothetical protein
MKGVIFNAVEDIVRTEHGEDTWDDLLESAGLAGSYTSLGTYPDAQMAALVEAACTLLGVSPEDLQRHLGRRSFGYLAGRNPDLMSGFSDSRSLLRALNSVIHPEVRKVYPGADVPDFEMTSAGPDSLTLSYRSNRGMCYFAEGLGLGVGDHFEQALQVTQTTCQHRGGDHCELVFTWTPAGV